MPEEGALPVLLPLRMATAARTAAAWQGHWLWRAVMDPTLIATLLLVLGLACLVLEIKIPGFFIAIPGTVMLLLGGLGLLVPGLLLSFVSPILALAGAVGASVLSIRFYKRLGAPDALPVTSTPESLIGESGVLVRPVHHGSLRGRVKLRGREWSCAAYEPLPEGTEVLVLGADHGQLIVGEAPRRFRESASARTAVPAAERPELQPPSPPSQDTREEPCSES